MEKRGRESGGSSSRNRYIKYYTKMHTTGIHLGRKGIWISKRRQRAKRREGEETGGKSWAWDPPGNSAHLRTTIIEDHFSGEFVGCLC